MGFLRIQRLSTSPALPIPPVLTWRSPATNPTPIFDVEYYGTEAVAPGWFFTLQRKASADSWDDADSVTVEISDEIEISASMAPLASGDYVARARFTTNTGEVGAWSDELSFSIEFVEHAEVIAHGIQFTETGSETSTFGDIDVGTGPMTLVIAGLGRGDGSAFGGITVDSVSMAEIVNGDGGVYGTHGLWTIDINPSAPVDIVVDWNSGKSGQPKAIHIWSVVGLNSSTEKSISTQANGNQPAVLSVDQGDTVFAFSDGNAPTTYDGNSSEDTAYEVHDGTYGIFTFAHFFPAADYASFSITDNTNGDRIAVSFA